jgi:hypothetical protein
MQVLFFKLLFSSVLLFLLGPFPSLLPTVCSYCLDVSLKSLTSLSGHLAIVLQVDIFEAEAANATLN